MKPVRIKYYGMFWMTKRTYFILLAATIGLAAMALVVAAAVGTLPPLGWPWIKQPVVKARGFWPFIINRFYFIMAVCIVAQFIDTLLVLRAFAKKEAEQQNQPGNQPVAHNTNEFHH